MLMKKQITNFNSPTKTRYPRNKNNMSVMPFSIQVPIPRTVIAVKVNSNGKSARDLFFQISKKLFMVGNLMFDCFDPTIFVLFTIKPRENQNTIYLFFLRVELHSITTGKTTPEIDPLDGKELSHRHIKTKRKRERTHREIDFGDRDFIHRKA